ncbi:MAG: TonB family protein [Acidobacteria bacterium]|nr:TonB family protein [Acidobacteriota bacterium]
MTGDYYQAFGPASPEEYESAVLEFLDKEMAVIGLTQDMLEPSNNLDEVVSNFLKQVIAVSDLTQSLDKTDSEETDGPVPGFTDSDETSISPGNEAMQLETESVRFESRDAMLAEYMAIQERASALENSAAEPAVESELGRLKDSDAMLAEFIAPKEADASELYQDLPPEPGIDASEFEALDAVLAELTAMQEEAPPAEAAIAPVSNTGPLPAESEEPPAQAVSPEPPQTIVSPPEAKSVPIKPVPMPQERQAVPGDIRKPETKSSVILKYPAGKTVSPKTPIRRTDSERIRPATGGRALNAKTLLIAAACVCVLAVLAVPVGYFPGSSENVSESAGRDASSAALPNHASPPVLISQVSPKYPAQAVKSGASASVTLDLSIDKNGNVVKATPVSGPELFHKEAIRAALKWRYKPASITGSSVPGKSRATFNFSLKK